MSRRTSCARGLARGLVASSLALLWLLAACGGPPVRATAVPGAGSGAALRVVLFPYIPDSVGDDFAALKATLASGFEAQHPGVDVEIVIDENLDLYDYAPGGTLSKLLGSGPEAAQLVEIDTLLMSTLVESGWVQPTGLQNPGVFATAWQTASVSGVSYGVPTYLCTNVIYSTAPTLTAAQNGTNLLGVLSAVKPGVPPLVGNYKGSWTLAGSYVDAWGDSNGTAALASSFALPLDQRTMAFFSPVVSSCASSPSKNPCLDGTYAEGTGAETAYAAGEANGYFGYTERLFYIRSAAPAAPLPQVASAPLGGGTQPTMFVDALVMNPGCQGSCLQNAQAFAAYMATPSVRTMIAFSQDGPPGTLPRYLLQASTAFYSDEPAASDPMYRSYLPIVQRATPYPNAGFPQSRRALSDALTQALTNPPPPGS